MTAITTRDPHRQFRDATEMLIKSFGFGPSESSLPAAPSRRKQTRLQGEKRGSG